MSLRAGQAQAAMRALPRASLQTLVGDATPIILAPHQDDEVIGCGGLIAALTEQGTQPVIVFVTDGSGSHPNSPGTPPAALVRLREQEARHAAEVLGVACHRLHFMRLPDTAAPHDGPKFHAATRDIAAIAAKHARPLLLAPWAYDPHCDHLAVHKMAASVAQHCGARHLSYPVWGWTLPAEQPIDAMSIVGWRLDITPYRQRKACALAAHVSQTTHLIDDDPEGFYLEAELAAQMISNDETFLTNA